jgi:hypothetical protein
MFNYQTKDYYKKIAEKMEDAQLASEIDEFHKENRKLPPAEYTQKLEERFGYVLKHLNRAYISNKQKSIATSLMWVRVSIIVSIIAGVIIGLLMLP